MKSLIAKFLRAQWRWTAPFRRPFVARFDRHVAASLSRVMTLHGACRGAELRCALPEEIELLLESTVRELIRLQMQVEVLQRQIEEVVVGTAPDDAAHDLGIPRHVAR